MVSGEVATARNARLAEMASGIAEEAPNILGFICPRVSTNTAWFDVLYATLTGKAGSLGH